MSKAQAGATAIMEALRIPLDKLRQAGNVAVPADDLCERAILGCLNSRDGSWRKTRPSNEESETLWALVKFHRSGGSLYGWPWFAPKDLIDPMDTLAVVLLGGRSNAANAWQRAMHG
jgi:hypothetical protein